MKQIALGDEVRDLITGQSGVVIGRTEWLYGCERVTIQPRECKDGKPVDSFCIDAAQCEIVAKEAIKGFEPAADALAAGPAGPRPEASRRVDPSR